MSINILEGSGVGKGGGGTVIIGPGTADNARIRVCVHGDHWILFVICD